MNWDDVCKNSMNWDNALDELKELDELGKVVLLARKPTTAKRHVERTFLLIPTARPCRQSKTTPFCGTNGA